MVSSERREFFREKMDQEEEEFGSAIVAMAMNGFSLVGNLRGVF